MRKCLKDQVQIKFSDFLFLIGYFLIIRNYVSNLIAV